MIIIIEDFIKLEINIPRNELKDFIIDISSSLNNLSNTDKSKSISTNNNKPVELLTIAEVAKLLKVNVNYVYLLIKAGHLEALKLGSLKITSTELERFINYANGKDFTDLNNITEL